MKACNHSFRSVHLNLPINSQVASPAQRCMPPKKPHLFETLDSALPFILTEGTATISLPKGKVFYNPVQHFNRDLSVAVIRTFFKNNPQFKVWDTI